MPGLVSSRTAAQTCDNTLAVNCLALGIAHQEFGHHLSAPNESAGPLRLRATLVNPAPTAGALQGQRVFVVQKTALAAPVPWHKHARHVEVWAAS
jgi:cholesterol transport system auxiliary component